MICLFHNSDLDGQCSGALIKMMYPECEMYGINYGEEFPWDEVAGHYDKIFVVDFCLQPFEDMVKLQRSSGYKVVWIDHHKSTIEAHEKWNSENDELKIDGIRKVGIGACKLVFDYIKKEAEVKKYTIPTFISLLAEYDVWDHSNPMTLPFQYGMRLQNTSPENVDFWFSLFDVEQVNRIAEDGSIILKYEQIENEKYIKSTYFETEFEGFRCICTNKMLTNSKVFDSVWDSSKYDVMLTFGWRKGKWVVSLYTDKENVDVSKVAVKHGGGGHKGASGFSCDKLPFELK